MPGHSVALLSNLGQLHAESDILAQANIKNRKKKNPPWQQFLMIVTARQKRKSRATGHGRKMKMGLRETLGSCQTHSPCESQNSPWENNDK